MGKKVLIMGESGTGKTTSVVNCNPEKVAVINPVGKDLPFRTKFDRLNGITDSKIIIPWVKEQVLKGKKIIVVDDFQYILSIPYMHRLKESGWDKWNDFQGNYFELIDFVSDLPEDVIVYFMTHTETLDDGTTTIKLMGKMLREKITIEGLFTIVLKTLVSDGKYYFVTQNSGKDTVKSPLGMFHTYSIDNRLDYVDENIRNYYELSGSKSDEEIKRISEMVAGEVEKPEGRRKRTRSAEREVVKGLDGTVYVQDEDKQGFTSVGVTEEPVTDITEEPKRRVRKRRTEEFTEIPADEELPF